MNNIPVFDPDTLAEKPVEGLIDLLIEHGDRVPRRLFDVCSGRGEAMVAAIADFYARPAAHDDRDTWWMELHALHLLGAIPGEAAGRLLISALRRAEQDEDSYLLDWVAGYMAWLFANKPPVVIDLAGELVRDRSARRYVRCEVADAVVAAGLAAGPEALGAALDWLAGLVADETDDADFRRLAANILLDFPRARHRALLDALAAEQEAGRRFGVIFDSSDVARSFEQPKDAPGWLRGGDPWKFYDDAQIQARQERWRDEAGAHAAGKQLGDDEACGCFHEPFVRKQPRPGRNDPCHCGSGRKYKKCCLAADETREARARLAH